MPDAWITIDGKLANLTALSSERCIFRVHEELRRVNPRAYEPETLAIGPYHRQKSHLQSMETHKLHYLKSLLNRRGEKTTKKYVEAIKLIENKARKCYSEPINLTSNEFVEMLVLDGIFILELFRKNAQNDFQNDPIFNISWIIQTVDRDLWLFENQIPFFILLELFNMTKLQHQSRQDLIYMALKLTQFSLSPGINIENISKQTKDYKHLLDLLHHSLLSPFENSKANCGEYCRFIHSVTELQEAGIKFKKSERKAVHNIKFGKGVMEIPRLTIEDGTESFFRNLIAHEQYCLEADSKIYTDYANIMDNLINSPKDVEILRRRGIIENLVGDDQVVSDMFNRLGSGVILGNGCYGDIFKNVNMHFNKKRNVWMAKLRHNYFSSPWSLISLIAAFLLLVLTGTQTLYAVVSYYKS